MTVLRRSRFFFALPLAVLLLGTAACSNSEKEDIQIREAVRQHLASRTDLGRMDVTLDEVEFDGDQATAKVTIQARDDENAKLQMTYNLQRVDSEWKVQPAAGAGHGGGGQPQGGAGMPPDHPPVGGQSQQPQKELPKGHPPVSN